MADHKSKRTFSWRTKTRLAERNSAGQPVDPKWIGETKCSLKQEVTEEELKGSFNGEVGLYDSFVKDQSLTGEMECFEARPRVLAIALGSDVREIADGTVTGEVVPNGLVVGDMIQLDHPFVSNVVLTDSTGAPVTLVKGTHYREDSLNAATFEILSLQGLTQPIKAAYSYDALENYPIFTKPSGEYFVDMEQINKASGERSGIQLYRVKFSPADTIAATGDGFASLKLPFKCLYDETRAADPELGGYGRFFRRGTEA